MNNEDIIDPDKIEISFPCLRARQPIGDIFVASIPFNKLKQFTYFDVRRVLQDDRDFERYLGIQRPLHPKRVKALEDYVNLVDASFPSSIIVALEEDYVEFDEGKQLLTLRNFRSTEKSPSVALAKLGRVLDGQHRIAGLGNFEGENFDLTVTIFVGADIADQAHIFATVNIEQTKVNKSLVYDLYELSQTRSPQKTCHRIVVALDRDPDGPFSGRIKRLGVATVGNNFEPVTQATMVEGVIGYISENPRIDRDLLLRGKKLEKLSGEELFKRPLRNMFVDGKDIEITQIFHNYFSSIQKKWPEAWDERGQGHVLNRTTGIRALLRYFRYAYLKVAAPGDIPSIDKFYDRVFGPKELQDKDFIIENFVPGSGGEARLFRVLNDKEQL